ncbi:alpha/beta hydrolase [Streptomyces sp. NPDC058374]|uniref:alpha/beta hydrolase n=1 Tax=Streptomyces sp. NPDC058374 TaxID=3346466 RepID=UPI0036640124
MAGLALASTLMTATTGWAASGQQTPVSGPPPGASAWRSDTSAGRELPDPASSTPTQVHRFFLRLTRDQQKLLAERHPLVLGNLDGAPAHLRYAANVLALADARAKEQTKADDARLTTGERDQAATRAERYRGLLAPGRQILAFDPRGRGQVAEVFGDLDASRHVAVIVPGSDIDLGTFDRSRNPYGAPAGMARSLAGATGDDTAVIAWVGYTTPVGLGPDAATGRLAQAGAPRLTRFTEGLVATGLPRPAVFCHSYGSVVCGLAAPGLRVSDLVVLGSPGMRAADSGSLRTTARVWAARSAGDWIGKVPHVRLFALGHGADPADPGFGARSVPAQRVDGHSGYFAPGTDALAAFAAIAEGKAA